VATFGKSRGRFRPLDTLRPLRGQPLAVIDQGESRQMPVMILQDAAIAHLGITEDTLQNAERPLHFCSNSRLSLVPALLVFIHALLGLHASIGHVLRLGRCRVDRLGLPLIAAISPDLVFLAMQ